MPAARCPFPDPRSSALYPSLHRGRHLPRLSAHDAARAPARRCRPSPPCRGTTRCPPPRPPLWRETPAGRALPTRPNPRSRRSRPRRAAPPGRPRRDPPAGAGRSPPPRLAGPPLRPSPSPHPAALDLAHDGPCASVRRPGPAAPRRNACTSASCDTLPAAAITPIRPRGSASSRDNRAASPAARKASALSKTRSTVFFPAVRVGQPVDEDEPRAGETLRETGRFERQHRPDNRRGEPPGREDPRQADRAGSPAGQ